VPDLRGHGDSGKPRAGYHVARLTMDLHNFIGHMKLDEHGSNGGISAIGTSLGAAILWYVSPDLSNRNSTINNNKNRSYAELCTTKPFSHMIFVDQAPLQNYLSDWGPEYGNRGLNNPAALADLQKTLETDPATAHRGTITGCLGYRSHPTSGDPNSSSDTWRDDEAFFLAEAMKGDGWWYGKLMADHTARDWRSSIVQNFGPESGSKTKVLVVASERSGCFPAAGPLKVVELVNGASDTEGKAKGVAVTWGGHWCYWEKPDLFNELAESFLEE
jgi:pimeloyl-ACP methyl ester carboxylesterase